MWASDIGTFIEIESEPIEGFFYVPLGIGIVAIAVGILDA